MALTQPLLDKKILNHYMTIELPEDKIQATYIWIDGTGEAVRCKTKTVPGIPKTAEGLCLLIHSVFTALHASFCHKNGLWGATPFP